MSFNQFLRKFEFTLISSLKNFYSLPENVQEIDELIKTLHQLTIYRFNQNMADLLFLRALERIVNSESEVQFSGEVRHKIFQFLKKEKVFDFAGIFSNGTKFGEISALLGENSPEKLENILILLREMTIVQELQDSYFNFNSAENSSSTEAMELRTGLEFVELFFEFLNHESGYHALNNFEEFQSDLGKFKDFVLVLDGLDYVTGTSVKF
jgi:hypothetical protein